MTITSNNEGVQFEPSPLLKAIFGERMMTDVYYERQQPKAEPKGKAAVKPSTK